MHGQGTLRWASGERYDGEWIEGEEDGLGVFTWRDGTTYDGFWQSGKKHGIGVRISSCLQGQCKPAPAVLTCSRLHCLDLGNLDTYAVLSSLLSAEDCRRVCTLFYMLETFWQLHIYAIN